MTIIPANSTIKSTVTGHTPKAHFDLSVTVIIKVLEDTPEDEIKSALIEDCALNQFRRSDGFPFPPNWIKIIHFEIC